MKLIYRILLHLSVVLSAVLTGWAIYFYAGIVEEVNDETDDALDDYAYTKYKAGGKTPGFDAKNNELKQFFPRKSKKPKPGSGDDIHLPEE